MCKEKKSRIASAVICNFSVTGGRQAAAGAPPGRFPGATTRGDSSFYSSGVGRAGAPLLPRCNRGLSTAERSSMRFHFRAAAECGRTSDPRHPRRPVSTSSFLPSLICTTTVIADLHIDTDLSLTVGWIKWLSCVEVLTVFKFVRPTKTSLKCAAAMRCTEFYRFWVKSDSEE